MATRARRETESPMPPSSQRMCGRNGLDRHQDGPSWRSQCRQPQRHGQRWRCRTPVSQQTHAQSESIQSTKSLVMSWALPFPSFCVQHPSLAQTEEHRNDEHADPHQHHRAHLGCGSNRDGQHHIHDADGGAGRRRVPAPILSGKALDATPTGRADHHTRRGGAPQ